MIEQGFSSVFERSKQATKRDYSDFRADPAFHFLSPVQDQIYNPDSEVLKIASEQDVELFLKYIRIEKPDLGYKTLKYYPLDKIDCRHIMMSTVIFKHLKSIKTVLEIGGGFGNWARINLKVHPTLKEWSIVDLAFVQDLQRWYLSNALDQSELDKVKFIEADESLPQEGVDLVIGAHSLSEVSLEYFNKYLPFIEKSKYLFYARHKLYPSAELSKIKMDILMSKFDIIENVKGERGLVDNILFRCKN